MVIYRRSYEQYEANISVNKIRYRKTFETRKEAEEWVKKTDYKILLETTQ